MKPYLWSSSMSSVNSKVYRCDVFGRRVLLGLTYAETHEFELLDAQPPPTNAATFCNGKPRKDHFRPVMHGGWNCIRNINRLALSKDDGQ